MGVGGGGDCAGAAGFGVDIAGGGVCIGLVGGSGLLLGGVTGLPEGLAGAVVGGICVGLLSDGFDDG